eukprot:TRINITY_DN90215_c0_g1_i1.p1 TRINITY_DN90215_c0_g1~~TRINITY_DN90215_c0_g1_i1.p1  ORF type:complete len:288 (+),score=23.36 TRINITY_DN90215_c0_g1_i1:122-865(+)
MALLATIQMCIPSPETQLGHSDFRRGRTLLQATAGENIGPPDWHGVLPDNIVDQQLPTVRNPHYGIHVVALGKNGSLFHRYQTGPINKTIAGNLLPMTNWICLTPDNSFLFGNPPAVALNADGRIELFAGDLNGSLDLIQMYQLDASNPLSWSKPRAPWCDAIGPPADPECARCSRAPVSDPCYDKFWNTGYVWTTSQQALWLDSVDKKLKLSWRSFTGEMYQISQKEPSNSKQWNIEMTTWVGAFE